MAPPESGADGLRMAVLVARHEFLSRARSRFYVVATVLLMAGMSGYIVLQAFVINRAGNTVTVGLAGQTQALAGPLQTATASLGVHVRTRPVADVASGERAVRAGSLDALVSGDPARPTVVVENQLDPAVGSALSQLARQEALDRALRTRGVDPSAIETPVAAARISLSTLNPDAAQRAQRQVTGVLVAVLLYLALAVYGQIIAQGVVEEKANRIVEILLSTLRPRQLLLGKVLGIGLVGFVQLVLVGGVAVVVATRTQVISAPTVAPVAFAGGLLWFVLGFVLYALVYAAAAALVSRQEDVGPVTMPITLVVIGSYLVLFWMLSQPANPLVVTLTMLPPLAPVLMPARMATGDAAPWQVLVAVVLTVAAIAALNALAGRIYANSVLRIGARVGLRDAWRGRR